MTSYDDVVARWIAIALGYSNNPRQLRNPRMPIDGDRIFSYGSHFEMARLLRNKHGEPMQWLINGDTWGVTTGRHQSTVRSGIRGTHLESVIIPYQALNAAGIDRDSLRILDVTPDRNEVKEHVHYEQPPGSIVEWIPVEKSHAELSWQEYRARLQAKIDQYNTERLAEWRQHQECIRKELTEEPDGKNSYGGNRYWTKRYWLDKKPKPVGLLGWGRTLNSWHARKTIDKIREYRTMRRVTSYRLTCYTNGWKNAEWEISYLPDGRTQYRRETFRHWLGESLISAEVEYTINRTCKWCSGTGRNEGPIPATWVPPQKETTLVRGFAERPYYREVETGIIIPGYWREEDRWGEHTPRCTACRGRARWTESRRRRSTFLSGFDANETRPSYFFCELPPKCKATTVEQAYDALKPDTVKLAEQMGREIQRQGDIFAVPLAATTKSQLRKTGARFERRGRLFGTNHVATETAYLPDGTTVVRGCLHHVPEFRRPDHRRIKLGDGKQWYVVQKNTVPLAA